MIVHDLDIVSVPFAPDETDPVLVVDANRMLAFAVALERFQPVPRRNGQIGQPFHGIEQNQLAAGNAVDAPKQLRRLIVEDLPVSPDPKDFITPPV